MAVPPIPRVRKVELAHPSCGNRRNIHLTPSSGGGALLLKAVSTIFNQRFDRLDLGLEISDPLQDTPAREWFTRFRFQHQEMLFSPQAFDERFQI